MSPLGFEGRVVAVTGGGSGIGRATCVRLVAEGARVAVVDRDAELVAGTVEELGADAHGIVADVSNAQDVHRYVDDCVRRFGRIDGLFNNAGVTAALDEIVDLDPAELERTLRINTLGTFLGMQAGLRAFREREGPGVLLSTASGLALRGAERQAAYAASKAAVISLTRTAALENARHGVRVNALLPGPTRTAMLDALPPELLDEYAQMVPLGRLGRSEEIAALAAWLLSDESSFVTGSIYLADGGEGA